MGVDGTLILGWSLTVTCPRLTKTWGICMGNGNTGVSEFMWTL